jgi:hypothetical protein
VVVAMAVVSTQPVAPPPLHDLTEKLKIVQLTWISVALRIGGVRYWGLP